MFTRGEGSHTPIMNVAVIFAHCESPKVAISTTQNISTSNEITSCEKNSNARESISRQQLRQIKLRATAAPSDSARTIGAGISRALEGLRGSERASKDNSMSVQLV